MRLRVEAVLVGGVDVRVARVVFSAGVVGDVLELILVVSCVCDAVCVVSILPDFAVELVAHGERETALDELDAAFGLGLDSDAWAGIRRHISRG